jgi:hypothetical protein
MKRGLIFSMGGANFSLICRLPTAVFSHKKVSWAVDEWFQFQVLQNLILISIHSILDRGKHGRYGPKACSKIIYPLEGQLVVTQLLTHLCEAHDSLFSPTVFIAQ